MIKICELKFHLKNLILISLKNSKFRIQFKLKNLEMR